MDKLLHFLVGAVIAAVFMPISPYVALAATVLAGMGKEVWDGCVGKTPDAMDAIATFSGGFLMMGWLWLFMTY